MGWVTYARPFAARRCLYRRKRAALDLLNPSEAIQWERMDCAFEAITWMWRDFLNHVTQPPQEGE